MQGKSALRAHNVRLTRTSTTKLWPTSCWPHKWATHTDLAIHWIGFSIGATSCSINLNKAPVHKQDRSRSTLQCKTEAIFVIATSKAYRLSTIAVVGDLGAFSESLSKFFTAHPPTHSPHYGHRMR